jgi:hypothetical protein
MLLIFPVGDVLLVSHEASVDFTLSLIHNGRILIAFLSHDNETETINETQYLQAF